MSKNLLVLQILYLKQWVYFLFFQQVYQNFYPLYHLLYSCIVNDITDKNFDKLVERTKNRPIASGKVSVKLASFYSFVLCGIAFLVLINFNFFTIWMALLSMPLAFSYPLMKRFTYWPICKSFH